MFASPLQALTRKNAEFLWSSELIPSSEREVGLCSSPRLSSV